MPAISSASFYSGATQFNIQTNFDLRIALPGVRNLSVVMVTDLLGNKPPSRLRRVSLLAEMLDGGILSLQFKLLSIRSSTFRFVGDLVDNLGASRLS